MKNITVFLIVAILQSASLVAQYQIKVEVDSMPTNKAYLFEYMGTQTKMIDSTQVDKGVFQFSLPEDAHPGLYRLVVGPNNFWDIIFNKEDIEMHTFYGFAIDSLRIIKSQENTLLAEYMQYALKHNRKREVLQLALQVYNPEDSFYNSLMTEYESVNAEDRDQITRKIIAEYPSTYAARFFKAELPPEIPSSVPKDKEMEFLLEHMFDGIDFMDTSLLYSPPLMAKVSNYFRMFSQAYPPGKVEPEMIKGLDRLMSRAAVNDVIFDHILDDITQWGERSPFGEFFAYFTEYYLSQAACKDEERAEEIGDLLEALKKTALGIQAPEIILPLEQNDPVILSGINARYKLVVFWASWCPHCNQVLPELKEIYNRHSRFDLEIIAISLDETQNEWQNALKKGGYDWFNYSELKGWDCSIAHDYGIRATPTLILMDKDRTIVAKPRSSEVLADKLIELGVKPIR